MKELIYKLNGLKIIQKSGDWAECLPIDIWDEHFKDNFSVMAGMLDVETHRWYEVSTSVIEINGILLGVTHISNMFSESQDYFDCYHTIKFHEMEEITIKSYKIK